MHDIYCPSFRSVVVHEALELHRVILTTDLVEAKILNDKGRFLEQVCWVQSNTTPQDLSMFLPFVISRAKKLSIQNDIEMNELIQEGMLCLEELKFYVKEDMDKPQVTEFIKASVNGHMRNCIQQSGVVRTYNNVTSEELPDYMADAVTPESSVLEQEKQRNRHSILMDFLDTLTDKQLEVARLYLEGATQDEIATQLNKSKQAVSQNLKLIMSKIKEFHDG